MNSVLDLHACKPQALFDLFVILGLHDLFVRVICTPVPTSVFNFLPLCVQVYNFICNVNKHNFRVSSFRWCGFLSSKCWWNQNHICSASTFFIKYSGVTSTFEFIFLWCFYARQGLFLIMLCNFCKIISLRIGQHCINYVLFLNSERFWC
jgi:hypothetical protein